ncbi:MAG: S-layer homology domain-containing protein [Clostridia bacterium]|nr:S-layer homology domain-containing protein [Clostridia bacterium]
MKTKVLALLLCCMMLASSLVVSAATFSDVPESHDRYTAINLLSGMDIITGFPDGTFKPDEPVTRAQMAALISRMFNLPGVTVSQKPFSDVEVDYWAASNIVAAKNRGIINGFPEGTFQPEAEVTYEQAVKMIICALNYGTVAESQGGYPGGYINQASKLDILKNAAATHSAPAARGIIAQLLYNSLEVEMLVPQINADGTTSYVKPTTGNNSVSQQYLKTETVKNAIVVRTPKVNLEPDVSAISRVNDDAMFIKHNNTYIKVTVPGTSAFDYIGQQVDVTYKTDPENPDEKVMTSITRSSSVMVYENIKLADVISLTSSGINYYTNRANDRDNNVRFNGNLSVIYNERLHTDGIAAINEDLTNVTNHEYANGVISVYVSGSQTLVKVKSYKTYVVDSVVASTETIRVKGGVIDGENQPNIDLYVPYKDTYTFETVMKKGNFDFATGKASAKATDLTSYSGIAKGNIISIAKSEGYPENADAIEGSEHYCEVIVSATAVTGIVEEYSTDDETTRPVIKVGKYSALRAGRDLDRYELTAVIQPEVNAKFHIDAFGEIGYVSNIKAEDINVGIPVYVTTGGSGFDRITQVEIYNVNTNQVETLRFRDEEANDPRVLALKEIVDYEEDEEGNRTPVYGGLITDSLFKYTLKNGQINTLEKIVAGTEDYTYVEAKSTEDEVDNIKKTSSTKITFDSGKEITYNSSSTKIIVIGAADDTSKVIPQTTTTMVINTPYTGKVYQLNVKKTGTNYNLQYVIIRPFEGLAKDSPTYIVDSVGSVVPHDDYNVVTLKVYNFTGTTKAGNGSAVKELKIVESVKNTLNLKKGDVFTYYAIPGTEGIDIETLKNVYVLARAEEIAGGTYPTTGAMQSDDNAKLATDGYNRDYRFFGIQNNTSNMVAPTTANVYAYYMGIPMAYISDDEDTVRTLRIARDATSRLPIMPGDEEDIAMMEGDSENGDNFYDYDITQLANIYVYDANASEGDKLTQVKGRDQVRAYLEGLGTIENNLDNTTKTHDVVMVKAYNTESNCTLYNLYIIKDAR